MLYYDISTPNTTFLCFTGYHSSLITHRSSLTGHHSSYIDIHFTTHSHVTVHRSRVTIQSCTPVHNTSTNVFIHMLHLSYHSCSITSTNQHHRYTSRDPVQNTSPHLYYRSVALQDSSVLIISLNATYEFSLFSILIWN